MAIVGAGPAGLVVRHPPEAAQARSQHLRAGEGLGRRRALALRRGDRAGAARCAAAGVAPVPARHLRAREARRVPPAHAHRQLPAAVAAAASQPRQLHHLARARSRRCSRRRRKRSASMCSPGFAAAEPLFNDDGSVAGVQPRRHGHREERRARARTSRRAPEVRARTTIIAEGARGSIAKQLIRRFKLDARLRARRPTRSA